MSTDDFRMIDVDRQRAYFQFGRNADAPLDQLKNELAKLLFETYLETSKQIQAEGQPIDMQKMK